MGTAIVAIPREEDYVWKISSEKIPHMTLLFLGDQADNPKLNDIVDYIRHAVETSLSRFGMSVDRRGVLGADNADVLFFDKSWSFKNIDQFRGYLLKNSDIFTAYASVQQFDGWTPHLTLGYPETPAKKDNRDYPGISYVSFDKIAVWTSDFEGPTFNIPSDEGLSEAFMSDPVEEFLAHHGVKGMKWGVRRANTTARLERVANGTASNSDKVKTVLGVGTKGYGGIVGYARAGKRVDARNAHDAKKVAKADQKWEKSIYTTKGAVAVHNNVAKQMNGGVLDKLNNNPKYKDKNLYENPKLQAQYNKDYEKLATQAYTKAVKEVHGSSPSGTKEAVYIDDPEQPRIEVRTKTVVLHADVSEPDLVIHLKLDANGFVVEAAEAELKHFDNADDILEHFGVRGMHWGVRKGGAPKADVRSPDSVRAKAAQDIIKKHGTKALDNKELQHLVTRMNLERQYSTIMASNPGTVKRGQSKVKDILSVVKTAQEVYSLANGPLAKDLRKALNGGSSAPKISRPKAPGVKIGFA